EKNIRLTMIVDPAIPEKVVGDALRISQILINLVGNAVKFTAKGEVRVEVSLKAQTETLCHLGFQVIDTGIGMDESFVHRLFKSFEQADASTTRRYGGTGLGLSITRHLVELMGGEIKILSKKGRGTQIRFDLSLEKQPRDKRAIASSCYMLPTDNSLPDKALQDWLATTLGPLVTRTISGTEVPTPDNQLLVLDIRGVKKLEIEAMHKLAFLKSAHPVFILDELSPAMASLLEDSDVSEIYNDNPVEALSNMSLNQLPGHTTVIIGHRHPVSPKEGPLCVLLVEDNDINQELATALLERVGIQVTPAKDGQEALVKLAAEDYDLVLMDMQMPVMDGLEATRRIRSQSGYENLPIIAMTANAMRADLDKCLAAGMNDYVTKPIDPDLLYRTIGKWSDRS
ncbi:MAG: ATP-binding protein, partial [Gammaproteobacteria bacterium]|nr:ATP-binding protein [Gammaproteobacteria bacterium]